MATFCGGFFYDSKASRRRQHPLRCVVDEGRNGRAQDVWYLAKRLSDKGQAKQLQTLIEDQRNKRNGAFANLKLHMLILKTFVAKNDMSEAVSHFEEMKMAGLRPDAVMYNFLMAEYARRKALPEIFDLRKEMRLYSIPEDAFTYSALIKAGSVMGNPKMAWGFYEELRKSRTQPNEAIFFNLASASARVGDVRRVHLAIRHMKSYKMRATTPIFNSLISACAKSADLPSAVRAFVVMQKEQLVPDCVTFTALISAYASVGDLDGIVASYEESLLRGIKPDIFLVSELIRGHIKYGRMVDAEHTFRNLHSLDLQADPILYCVMIDAYGRNRELAKAVSLFNEMSSRGVRRNSVIFNALMDAHIKNHDYDGAIETFHRIVEENMKPNALTFSTLIHAFSRKGDLVGAEKALKDMTSMGISPLTGTFTTLIDGFANAGNVQKAHQYYIRVKQNKKFRLESRVYNSMMRAYLHSGYYRRVIRQYKNMIRHEVTPDEYTFGMLIDAHAAVHSVAELEEVLRDMELYGVKPDAFIECAILRAYGSNGLVDSALNFFDKLEMKSAKHFTAVVEALLDDDDVDNGLFLCGRAVSYGACDQHLLNLYLELLLRKMHWDQCLPTLSKFSSMGIHTNLQIVERLFRVNRWTWREILQAVDCNQGACDVFLSAILKAAARSGDEALLNEIEHERQLRQLGTTRCVWGVRLAIASADEETFRSTVAACERDNVPFDLVLASSVLDLLGRSWQLRGSVKPVIREMKARNINPNLSCFSSMMGYLARKRSVKGIVKLMKEMREMNFEPDAQCYNRLIECWIGRSRLPRARLVVHRMEAAGVNATAGTYHILIRGHSLAGQHALALALFLEQIRRGLRPNSATKDLVRVPLAVTREEEVTARDDTFETRQIFLISLANAVRRVSAELSALPLENLLEEAESIVFPARARNLVQ